MLHTVIERIPFAEITSIGNIIVNGSFRSYTENAICCRPQFVFSSPWMIQKAYTTARITWMLPLELGSFLFLFLSIVSFRLIVGFCLAGMNPANFLTETENYNFVSFFSSYFLVHRCAPFASYAEHITRIHALPTQPLSFRQSFLHNSSFIYVAVDVITLYMMVFRVQKL